MRAALIGADRVLTVTDIERLVPAVGEVLIDVRYCGICGSDLHMLVAEPLAVAHIAAGRIPCDRIITRVAPLDSAPAVVAELHGGVTDQVKVLLTPSGPT